MLLFLTKNLKLPSQQQKVESLSPKIGGTQGAGVAMELSMVSPLAIYTLW